jgi:hypothetical protein
MVVVCDICGKHFEDRGQKFRPINQMKQHKKNCFRIFKKKQRLFIKDFSINASDIEINRVYMFLQNQEQYIEENMPIINNPNPNLNSKNLEILSNVDTDSDRPASNTSVRSIDSVSTSSELDDWNYQNIQYFLDNKNRVYDEYNNKIGSRIKDEFSEEFKIEYN